MSLAVEKYELGPIGTNSYLVRADQAATEAVVIDPGADVAGIRAGLAAIPVICAGGPAAGALGALSTRERFHWLVAPRSTSIQTSPVHTGRCDDLDRAAEHLLQRVVRAPVTPSRAR